MAEIPYDIPTIIPYGDWAKDKSYADMIRRRGELASNTVVFNAEKLGVHGTPMKAEDFHLPFNSMLIRLKKPYRVLGVDVPSVYIADPLEAGLQNESIGEHIVYAVVCTELQQSLRFLITETGEIVLFSLDNEKHKIGEREQLSHEEFSSFFERIKHGELYTLVYEIISTIDYINSCDYVITKHNTDSRSGVRLPSGVIQQRIKIKREKIKRPDYKGTGLGTKHRYKYRVRGHWRDLENGKRTWIKDHVRGGDGTIFIPKEYDMEGAEPVLHQVLPQPAVEVTAPTMWERVVSFVKKYI